MDWVVRWKSTTDKVWDRSILPLSFFGHYRSPLCFPQFIFSFTTIGHSMYPFPDFIIDVTAYCEVYNWVFIRKCCRQLLGSFGWSSMDGSVAGRSEDKMLLIVTWLLALALLFLFLLLLGWTSFFSGAGVGQKRLAEKPPGVNLAVHMALSIFRQLSSSWIQRGKGNPTADSRAKSPSSTDTLMVLSTDTLMVLSATFGKGWLEVFQVQ